MANESIVYSYKSFDAFAAKLTVNEMQRMSGMYNELFVTLSVLQNYTVDLV